MLTENDIREALRVCFDTELSLNIVDLGLIEHVTLTRDEQAPGPYPRYRIHLALLRRTHEEQREALLTAQIANRLAGLPEISHTTIELLETPIWTPDRLTDSARQQRSPTRPTALVQIKL